MKRTRALTISLIAALIAAVALALAAGGSARTARSSAATVSVRQTALGRILVGTNGHTLYLFMKDKRNVSTLSRAGFAFWPAFQTQGGPRAGAGASSSKIRTIASLVAKHQVTYAGHPLYYYVGDKRPGSTSGEGLLAFGARWYAVSASGKAVTAKPVVKAPAAPSPAPEPGYGGMGY